jgi:formylglycine-generating enzyme required for sulfatase activity
MLSSSSRWFRSFPLLALLSLLLALPGCSELQPSSGEPQMVVIPAGSIDVGNKRPATIKSFELAKFDVTRAEFAVFARATHFSGKGCTTFDDEGDFDLLVEADWEHPGFPQTDRDPVVCLNYDDMMSYIRWLSAKTGIRYRLPSEAELRYAAQAGQTENRYVWETETAQCTYANGADLTYHGKYPNDPDFNEKCSDGYVFTSPVGSFEPNPFGLYDTFGNVYQRVADCFNQYVKSIPLDGSSNKTSTQTGSYDAVDATGKITHQLIDEHPNACAGQVVLGGSWAWAPPGLAIGNRQQSVNAARDAQTGFRLARDLVEHQVAP